MRWEVRYWLMTAPNCMISILVLEFLILDGIIRVLTGSNLDAFHDCLLSMSSIYASRIHTDPSLAPSVTHWAIATTFSCLQAQVTQLTADCQLWLTSLLMQG
jgi:hypothetical protein